jgi:hypothetical protein
MSGAIEDLTEAQLRLILLSPAREGKSGDKTPLSHHFY